MCSECSRARCKDIHVTVFRSPTDEIRVFLCESIQRFVRCLSSISLFICVQRQYMYITRRASTSRALIFEPIPTQTISPMGTLDKIHYKGGGNIP